jgi:hypothetical protein
MSIMTPCAPSLWQRLRSRRNRPLGEALCQAGALQTKNLIHVDQALPADLDQHTGGTADLDFR